MEYPEYESFLSDVTISAIFYFPPEILGQLNESDRCRTPRKSNSLILPVGLNLRIYSASVRAISDRLPRRKLWARQGAGPPNNALFPPVCLIFSSGTTSRNSKISSFSGRQDDLGIDASLLAAALERPVFYFTSRGITSVTGRGRQKILVSPTATLTIVGDYDY
jgi:hypothetical protein